MTGRFARFSFQDIVANQSPLDFIPGSSTIVQIVGHMRSPQHPFVQNFQPETDVRLTMPLDFTLFEPDEHSRPIHITNLQTETNQHVHSDTSCLFFPDHNSVTPVTHI
jgi:hypothetical protein